MSKIKMFISTFTIVLLFSICISAQTNCLFIGHDPNIEPNAENDPFMVAHLDSMGYRVEAIFMSDALGFSDEDYADYDFIFLSETTYSGDMSPLKDIPKPMLCSDGWGAKESSLAFGLGEPVGILEPAQPVIFLNGAAGHPLGAGYTPGTIVELGTVLERKDPCLIVWAKPTIPIIPIAGVESDSTQLIVYGIEKGTTNASGEAIKNRVAVVGVHAWGYDVLTEAGVKVFKAGIDWVLGEN